MRGAGRGRLAALLAALATVLATSVHAGSQLPCSEPRVFQGAAVNSFVLPFRYVGSQPTPELLRASREISALAHFEILFGLLKHGRVGGTDLVAVPGLVCDVDTVIDQVTRGAGPGALLPGQTLVLTWGRLFEQGDDLYVQTYVRFLRQGRRGPERETITVPLAGDGTKVDLMAALPAQAIAFPARRISRQDLERIGQEFRLAMVVRPTRDMQAPGQSIDFNPERAFPYGITRAEGDWMWIEPMAGGPKGWVRARVGDDGKAGEWSLRRWLPELVYVDAVAGFLRLRAGKDFGAPPFERTQAAIEAALQRFEVAVIADDAPAAHGLAQAMRGFLEWDAGAATRQTAARRFAQALKLMPEYAAARNLAALTRPLQAGAALDAKVVARMARELNGALALDPGDRLVLDNMERLLGVYAVRGDWSPYDAEAVAQRLAIVKATRAKVPAGY
ncbi:MAG: hypothetical protein C0505_10965 [Leptothrix sp. (in: Bacteria)]|nr:hypothetical protein [Leptothrix sp. (in: b-proteobacteria)]